METRNMTETIQDYGAKKDIENRKKIAELIQKLSSQITNGRSIKKILKNIYLIKAQIQKIELKYPLDKINEPEISLEQWLEIKNEKKEVPIL